MFPEPLTGEEEKMYLQQMKNGDSEARNVLIERNLLSIGTIGLIKGINTFNVDKGSKLSTYVSRCIDNATITCWKIKWQLVSCLIN